MQQPLGRSTVGRATLPQATRPMPSTDYDRQRATGRRADAKRDRRAYQQLYRLARKLAAIDPNIRREYMQERRFRFRDRTPPEIFGSTLIRSLEARRPTFHILTTTGMLEERWETPDELIRRLEKKGALMTRKTPRKPHKSKKSRRRTSLDPTTARRILHHRTDQETKDDIVKLLWNVPRPDLPPAHLNEQQALEWRREHTRKNQARRDAEEAERQRQDHTQKTSEPQDPAELERQRTAREALAQQQRDAQALVQQRRDAQRLAQRLRDAEELERLRQRLNPDAKKTTN